MPRDMEPVMKREIVNEVISTDEAIVDVTKLPTDVIKVQSENNNIKETRYTYKN